MVNLTAEMIRVTPGGSTTLTCTVESDTTMSYIYLWFFDDAIITGQGSTTLTLTSFSIEDVGIYTCRVFVFGDFTTGGTDSVTVILGGERLN